nr:hypothetical protein [Phaseolus vulgaris]
MAIAAAEEEIDNTSKEEEIENTAKEEGENNDDNTGRTMRVDPQSVSKKCGDFTNWIGMDEQCTDMPQFFSSNAKAYEMCPDFENDNGICDTTIRYWCLECESV